MRAGKTLPIGWKPDDSESQAINKYIEEQIKEGQVDSIDSMTQHLAGIAFHTLHQSRRKRPKNGTRGGYFDSRALKHLCRLRNAIDPSDSEARAQASKMIWKQREDEQAAYKEMLCDKVANLCWSYAWEAKQNKINNINPQQNRLPDKLVEEDGTEHTSQNMHAWPPVVKEYWGKVYEDKLCPWHFRRESLVRLCMQVTALTMYLVLDGCLRPLFSLDVIDKGISTLRTSKSADRWGITAELLKCLGPA